MNGTQVPTEEGRDLRTLSPLKRCLRFMRQHLLTRFTLMMVLPAIGIFAIWIHVVEPNRIVSRQETVTVSNLKSPTMRRSLRIGHISDLRLKSEKSVIRMQKAIEALLKLHPDMAVLTGNIGMPNSPKDLATVESTLAYLRSIMPTFACLGNEDYLVSKKPDGRIMTLLLSAGIHVLQNERKELIVNGTHVTVVGLEDLQARPNPDACLTKLNETEPNSQLILLLSHNPDSLPLVKDYRWHIMFSGHTLGGQCRFPLTNWCPFADNQLTEYAAKGVYELPEGRRLSVTAGIGNTREMRLNCFPEVTLIEIKP